MITRTERVGAHRDHGAPTAPVASTNRELLPVPAPASGASADTLLSLQTILLRMSETSTTTAQARIERNEKLVEKAIDEAHEARKREAEARSEDGGFFDGIGTTLEAFTVDLAKLETLTDPSGALERSLDKAGDATIHSRQFWADFEKGALEVAKWAAVAGSVALAVVSFGAAAPVAALAICGAVMSCAAAADSTFHVLEACGVDADTAKWIDVGLCVGGALCSGGAGLGMALQGGASTATSAVRTGGTIADGAAGGATAAGGLSHTQVARFEHDAKQAEADATAAQHTQLRVERRIQQTLEAIRETLESRDRGVERIGESMNRHNATMVAMVRA